MSTPRDEQYGQHRPEGQYGQYEPFQSPPRGLKAWYDAKRAANRAQLEAQGGPFRPGFARIPWRVLRIFLVTTVLVSVVGMTFWNGHLVTVGLGAAMGLLLITGLAIVLYTLLRISSTLLGLACLLVAAAIVIVGGAPVNDLYLGTWGERVDAIASTHCVRVSAGRGGGHRLAMWCTYPLRHPDGREITDDFEDGGPREPANARLGDVADPPITVYWDPAGLIAPTRSASVENPAKFAKALLSLGLLAGSLTVVCLIGELARRRKNRHTTPDMPIWHNAPGPQQDGRSA